MVSRAVGKLSMKVDIAGLINIEKEVNRAQEELERITKFSQSLEKQLANKGFVDHAPTEVVALTKEKLATQKEKSKELEKRIKELNHL
jgi:valyl-tRNA synthetase